MNPSWETSNICTRTKKNFAIKVVEEWSYSQHSQDLATLTLVVSLRIIIKNSKKESCMEKDSISILRHKESKRENGFST